MSSLCELFQNDITYLCTPPKDSDIGSEEKSGWPSHSSEVLFSAIDALILNGGYALSDDNLSRVEQCIYKALLSMLKGIYCIKLPNNRKLQRSSCENLRSNSELQTKILRMALHFTCTAHRHGISSFIVSLLKQCCENAIGVVSLNAVATEVLCSLDVLTMPTSVVIPSSSVSLTLQDQIIERQRSQSKFFILMETLIRMIVIGVDEQILHEMPNRNFESCLKADVPPASPGSPISTPIAAEKVIDLTIEEDTASTQESAAVMMSTDNARRTAEMETARSTDDARRRIEATFAPAPSSKRVKVVEEDEDNDSIPDINMD